MSLFLSSWDLVQVYLVVLREGSLSSAARRLRISQPTVRRQVEALEAELGVTLFTRAPTGLIPTDTGVSLLAQAEAVEAAMGAFRRGATGQATAASGTVRIACSDVYGVEVIPTLLAPLMQDHPGLTIELVLSNRAEDLLKREADIAVRMLAPWQAALIAKKVTPIELGLFASEVFLDRHPAITDYDDFAERGLFIGDDRRDIIAKGFAAANLLPPKNIVFRTDSDLAQIAAIRSGLGIGICQTGIAAGAGLIRVLPNLGFTLESWVVMHEDMRNTRRVRLVFDHLVHVLNTPLRKGRLQH